MYGISIRSRRRALGALRLMAVTPARQRSKQINPRRVLRAFFDEIDNLKLGLVP